jgi:Flp pilus assembly protein TadB
VVAPLVANIDIDEQYDDHAGQRPAAVAERYSATVDHDDHHQWRQQSLMAGLIWTIIVVLFVLWILGFAVFHLGALIHLLIVIAVILLIFNLVTGRGARI